MYDTRLFFALFSLNDSAKTEIHEALQNVMPAGHDCDWDEGICMALGDIGEAMQKAGFKLPEKNVISLCELFLSGTIHPAGYEDALYMKAMAWLPGDSFFLILAQSNQTTIEKCCLLVLDYISKSIDKHGGLTMVSLDLFQNVLLTLNKSFDGNSIALQKYHPFFEKAFNANATKDEAPMMLLPGKGDIAKSLADITDYIFSY